MSANPERKRVRRKDADWPTPAEIDRELASRLYEGRLPFKDWRPCHDLRQAVAIAQDLAWKRGWNFELKWISYAGNILIDYWDATFTDFNYEASQRQDYKNAVREYWARANQPADAVCRAILNLLDEVESNEYQVCPVHGTDGCPPQTDDDDDDDDDEEALDEA